MRNGILGLFAFISLTLSAQAQGQIRSESIQTSPKPKVVDAFGLFYKPNDVATGVREFKPGDIVLSQPTRWAVSAQIEERASFGSDADANVIAPDTIMPLFLVSNLPGALEEQQVFCTVAKYQKKRVSTGLFAVLANAVDKSLNDGQNCLWDKDGDGKAEFGFRLNIGTPNDRAPQPIPPINLNIEQFREAGQGDRIVIKLENSKRPRFSIDVIQQGKSMAFDTITVQDLTYSKQMSLHKDAQYPAEMDIMGANIRIVSFDKVSRLVKIELGLAEREKLVVVPMETVVKMRYGY